MPVQVSYPGVYVQEQGSGARAIAGVPTAITAFIGMAEQGRMLVPVKLQNFAQFEQEFGTSTSGELADQLRQFFLNGGATAYVVRIANGALQAKVTLQSEGDADVLTLTARDPGLLGDMIRARVDYATASPERTFNLTVFRRVVKLDGTLGEEAFESFAGLSMDPASPDFAETRLNRISALVTAEVLTPPAANPGVSIGGRVLQSATGDAINELAALFAAGKTSLRIAVAGFPPAQVALPAVNGGDTIAATQTAWAGAINTALQGKGVPHQVDVTITGAAVNTGGVGGGRLLQISCATGSVEVRAATSGDITADLGLGVGAGGIEGDAHGDRRPAPTGVASRNGNSTDTWRALRTFIGGNRADITGFTLDDDSGDPQHNPGAVIALGGAGAMFEAGATRTIANARTALDAIAQAINDNSNARWTGKRTGNRIALTPRYGIDNTGPGVTLATTPTVDLASAGMIFAGVGAAAAGTPNNVAAYTVGMPGAVAGGGQYQVAASAGDNGGIPLAADYADAFDAIEQGVDLFNLMVLPRAAGQTDAARQTLWGAASAFCYAKRAFLIVDPRSTWTTIALAEAEIDQLRIGIETRNAAAYWPRLKVDDGTATGKAIDPGGSVAGLYARIDANRGVWKAPAGLEATIRGVTGLERRLTDPENGSINPKALNALRIFPAGVVGWGARTLVGFDGSGDIDDKYVPVRRTALYIMESLYRGLHFAVFEPNDEPLWAQIRLAAGSFMNGMFRQGAFAGAKTTDAYFVACDATTTTETDRNLGIVNVIVGFAPLKPAEFVVLTVKQIAGQVQI